MLLFEKSREGRGCAILPECDVPVVLPQEKDARETAASHARRLSEVWSFHATIRSWLTKREASDDGFYPLGSCTMKYNPRVNEQIAALEGFNQIHPLQPQDTVQGCMEVMALAEKYLVRDHRHGSHDPPACSRCPRRVDRSAADESISYQQR